MTIRALPLHRNSCAEAVLFGLASDMLHGKINVYAIQRKEWEK